MMGLQMRQRLRQELRCRTCGFSHDDERSKNCPSKLIDQLMVREPTWECPACHGQVQVNRDDFLQCRSCAARFSTSIIGEGDGREPVYIKNRIPHDTYQQVRPLKGLGKKRGLVFKIDVMVKMYREQARAWRRQRREAKRDE